MRDCDRDRCRYRGDAYDVCRARLGKRRDKCCIEFIDIKLIMLGVMLIIIGIILISCRICR